MQLPIQLVSATDKSLQEQIAEQIRQLIFGQRLVPGMRMPATRELARDLQVSRNTVTGAYARLIAEGLMQSREPTGTFVAERIHEEGPSILPLPSNVGDARSFCSLSVPMRERLESHRVMRSHARDLEYDFWVGRPDARLFPMRAWQSLLTRMLRGSARQLCEYGDPQGWRELRAAVAAHVGATRGIATVPERIVITNGIQEGLNLLACLLVAPGVPVAVENPCYRGAANVFVNHGATLLPVAVDGDGLVTQRLPLAAPLVYTTPSHQYPLGATLSLARRQALLEWAGGCGAYVVEDDYDSDFFYDGAPLPALKSLDRGDQVIYLGTFSKSLGAGLRIGYMVLPEALVGSACHAKALLNNCQPWLEQAALAAFIAEGGYVRHLRRLRQQYAARRNHLCAALSQFFPDWAVDGGGGGMHVVAHLPRDGPDAQKIEQQARISGIGIYGVDSGNALAFDEPDAGALPHVLLLGYAAMTETEISDALLRLHQAFEWSPPLTERANRRA